MKDDDVEHEKRRASAEKHNSMQEAERKKEKKKNLERQALEERHAKARREVIPEEYSPDEDDDDDEDSEGMAARLDRVLQGLLQSDVSSSRAETSKGPQGGDQDGRQKESNVSSSSTCRHAPFCNTLGVKLALSLIKAMHKHSHQA